MKQSIAAVDIQTIDLTFDKPVGGSGVTGVDILVATVRDNEGASGLGFSYVIGGGSGDLVEGICRRLAEKFLHGQPLRQPAEHWTEIRRSFNRTGQGPNYLALCALDVALWDLKARRENVPLCVALGGRPSPVPVYASGGFSPAAAPAESAALARDYIARGYRGVKPRVNANEKDAAVMDAVRCAIGPDAALMVDANEKGRADTAGRLLACAADFGVAFVEEPLPGDDLLGYRALGALAKRAPIAAGEHLQGQDRFAVVMADGYLGYVQPDLAFAGGLTPCLEVAQGAARHGIAVAPHFLPGLFIHLSGAFDGQLLLEEFPLVEPAFDGWPQVASDGTLVPSDRPGHGLTLRS
jgi:L-alanine-DL-glutamate epimerase-like enolase superfamily enzyme